MEDMRKRILERTDRTLEENQSPKSSTEIEYHSAGTL